MIRLNEESYLKLIEENIQWLKSLPHSIEKDHIILILKEVSLSPKKISRLEKKVIDYEDLCKMQNNEVIKRNRRINALELQVGKLQDKLRNKNGTKYKK